MSAQSDAIVQQLERVVADVKHALAVEIVRLLQRPPAQGGTPVATGNARDSWRVSSSGEIEIVDNDASYIMRLNDGWSAQAPAGFIERCIDEAQSNLGVILARPITIGRASGLGGFEYSPAGVG